MVMTLSHVTGYIHFHAHGKVLLVCMMLAIILSCVRSLVSRRMTSSTLQTYLRDTAPSKNSRAALLICGLAILPFHVSMAQRSAGVANSRSVTPDDTVALLRREWMLCAKVVRKLGRTPTVAAPVLPRDISPERIDRVQAERDMLACQEQVNAIQRATPPARSEVILPIRKQAVREKPNGT